MTSKDHILSLLNQFMPVVLGVYVGIWASNWNENRAKKAEQREYIENIKQEISVNKAILEETITYQKVILKSSRQAYQDWDEDVLEAKFWRAGHWNQFPEWKGLQIPRLQNSVYTSGLMINAMSGMEFKNINSISLSYNHQEEYNRYIQKQILDFFINIDSDIKTFQILNKLEVWYDAIVAGEVLVEQYKQTLIQLETI